MHRRGVLIGGAALAGAIAGAARAQAPGAAVDELAGRLDARTAGRFVGFVSDHVDRTVSLRVTAAPVDGRGFSVTLEAPLLLINTERPEKVQVSLTGGYAMRGPAFTMDGVYRAKAEGMQQGITILVLEPVPPGEVGRLRAAIGRKVAL